MAGRLPNLEMLTPDEMKIMDACFAKFEQIVARHVSDVTLVH